MKTTIVEDTDKTNFINKLNAVANVNNSEVSTHVIFNTHSWEIKYIGIVCDKT